MKKINNKSGFTLIEIIVVLIIVGILAAIALPNLFQNVQKSRGSAALAAMDGIKTALEQVALQNNRVPATADIATAGLPTAAVPAGSTAFQYTIATASGTPAANDLTYVIEAADASGNGIGLTRSTTGTFSCNGSYAGTTYATVC